MREPYHAGDNRVLGELLPEWLLIAHTVLDHDNCGAAGVYDRLQLGCHVALINGLVRADDVVHRRCFRRGFDHYDLDVSNVCLLLTIESLTFVRTEVVLAMVLAVDGDSLE